MDDGWRRNLVEDPAEIAAIAREARRIVVLGIKPDDHAAEPAHYVPAYLVRMGLEVIPVPVYYPEVTEILGLPVVRDLGDVAGPVDMVDVFRRSKDVLAHVGDLLALRPKVVWMQSGIRNADAAATLARAGIRVVQDRCLMIEHERALAG